MITESCNDLLIKAMECKSNFPFHGIQVTQPEVAKEISEIIALDSDPTIQIPIDSLIELVYDNGTDTQISFIKNLVENNDVKYISLSLSALNNIYDSNS